uniref:prefoldin subunit 1 n=1 Tax=Myxine glutinosa TaxID=7769 RepID=UPI00358EAD09
MAVPVVDRELQKAFVELQARVIEAQRQEQQAEGRMEALSRTAMTCKLTLQEISTLPSKTRLFQGVGRMFLLQDREYVLSDLKSERGEAENCLGQLKRQKEELSRRVDEAEKNIREMLAARHS